MKNHPRFLTNRQAMVLASEPRAQGALPFNGIT